MGEIRTYTCSCGYHSEVFIGSGLQSCNISAIKKHFSSETLSEFLSERDLGNIESFLMENVLATCTDCMSLFTVCGFMYKTKDHTCHTFINSCPTCGRKPLIIQNPSLVPCPKCSQIMQFLPVGDWD